MFLHFGWEWAALYCTRTLASLLKVLLRICGLPPTSAPLQGDVLFCILINKSNKSIKDLLSTHSVQDTVMLLRIPKMIKCNFPSRVQISRKQICKKKINVIKCYKRCTKFCGSTEEEMISPSWRDMKRVQRRLSNIFNIWLNRWFIVSLQPPTPHPRKKTFTR